MNLNRLFVDTSAASVVPTAKDIGKYKSMLYDLLLMAIPRRKKTPRGRFDKYETARRDYISISNCALPRMLPHVLPLPRLELQAKFPSGDLGFSASLSPLLLLGVWLDPES